MATLSGACGVTTGTFTGITQSSTNCFEAGGVKSAWFVAQSGLDLTAMALPANFDATGCGKLTNFVMTGGALYKPIEHDGLSTTYTRTYEGGKYTHRLVFEFKGTSCDRECQVQQLRSICPGNIVFQMNDCTVKMAGIEASISGGNATLSKSVTPIKLVQDDIDGKTVDDTVGSSHIIAFEWKTLKPSLCVTATTIPT